MVDLQGGVIEAEPGVQHRLHIASRSMTVLLARDQHVCRQRGEAAGHLPHVQIVHLNDPRPLGERPADCLRVQPLRRCLEEYATRGLQQQVGRSRHDPGDAQRGDRVSALKPRQQDDRGGQRGTDEAIEVGQHMLKAALHAQALPVGGGEHSRSGEVDEHAHQRDREDEAGAHSRRGEQAVDRLVRYERGQDQQAHAIGLGREDLHAL